MGWFPHSFLPRCLQAVARSGSRRTVRTRSRTVRPPGGAGLRRPGRHRRKNKVEDLKQSKSLWRPPGFSWHTTGLGAREEQLSTHRFGKMSVERLSTTMARLGHSFIDILKVDIEGHEWEAFLSDIFASEGPLPFGQLLIEVHVENFRLAGKFFDVAEQRGLRMFFKEPNQYAPCNPLCRQAEVCFVNVATTPRLY
jgi:hypothetical protein